MGKRSKLIFQMYCESCTVLRMVKFNTYQSYPLKNVKCPKCKGAMGRPPERLIHPATSYGGFPNRPRTGYNIYKMENLG